jgi:hypothetical protein
MDSCNGRFSGVGAALPVELERGGVGFAAGESVGPGVLAMRVWRSMRHRFRDEASGCGDGAQDQAELKAC